MRVFSKITSMILCLSFIFCLPTNTLADGVHLEILEISNDGETVYVSCRKIGDLTPKLTLICRGEDNSILHIDEYTAPDYGFFELTFPISDASNTQQYTVSIGGLALSSPVIQSFYLADTTPVNYIFIQSGQTVADLKNELKNNNAVITRNSNPLLDTDILKTNDNISLTGNTGNVELHTLILGDVDINGTVTSEDALYILQHIVDKITLSGISFQAAKTDRTDVITSSCALLTLQLVVQRINRL